VPMSVAFPSPHWVSIARGLDDGQSREISLIVAPIPKQRNSTMARCLMLRGIVSQAPYPETPGAFHVGPCGDDGFTVAINLGHAIRICRWSNESAVQSRCSWWRRSDQDVQVVVCETKRGALGCDGRHVRRQNMFCATFDAEDFLTVILPQKLGLSLASSQNRTVNEAAVVKDYSMHFIRLVCPRTLLFEVCIVCYVAHTNESERAESPWLLALTVELSWTSFRFTSTRKARAPPVVTPESLYKRGAKLVADRRSIVGHASTLTNDAVLSGEPIAEMSSGLIRIAM